MYRIFARDPSLEPLTTAIFERQLHEEDRGRVMAAIQRAIHEHVPYDLEYRFVIGTGEVRHFHGRAQCYVDASGTATRLSGTITDITGRKEMHEALELGTERVAWQGGCGALLSGVGRGIPGTGSESPE
jgi:PAS domain-containing protein